MVDPLVRVTGLLAAEAVNRTPATSVSPRGPRIRAAEHLRHELAGLPQRLGRRAGVEAGNRVVLQVQLHGLGVLLGTQARNEGEAKVQARCHAPVTRLRSVTTRRLTA